MKIGFAKTDITPDVGIHLAGYIPPRQSTGVQSPLYAKALVLKNWRKTYLWLSLDVVAIDHLFLVKFKSELKKHHFQFEDIQVVATHTHSGPCGTCESGMLVDAFGEPDEDYIKKLAVNSVNAVKKAMMDFSAFSLQIGTRKVDNFAKSRHDEKIEVSNKLTTLLFERGKKKEDILVYHFACHPTVLHQDNQELSSDFIGAVDEQLEDIYPNVMFLNGACGNISTRFTRSAANTEELHRLSTILSTQIKECVKSGEDNVLKKYRADHFSYDLKKKAMMSIEEAEKAFQDAKAAYDKKEIEYTDFMNAAMNYSMVASDDGNEFQEIHISIVTFNNFHAVFVPAEIFDSLASKISSEFCIVVGYANGYHAYIADMDAYKNNYYEAKTSYFEIGEGEKLIRYINEKVSAI